MPRRATRKKFTESDQRNEKLEALLKQFDMEGELLCCSLYHTFVIYKCDAPLLQVADAPDLSAMSMTQEPFHMLASGLSFICEL